ncbi:D-alanyl-D-alanine carboxypeptidase [Streptomyces sp. NPDC006527]|uniref:D-alanyl-D-alanine carboxypeptidase n=1 Tax=Streptomyces sp. NPDC006527 TaxID=3364749 RepID=UPI00369BC9A0
MEEASVAGESPDRSKQRESSAEPTSGSAGTVPEARDPRVTMARENESSNAASSPSRGGVDTATRVFSVRDLKTEDRPEDAAGDEEREEAAQDASEATEDSDGPEGAESPQGDADAREGGDQRLRAAVAQWVASADEKADEKAAGTSEEPERNEQADKADKADKALGAEAGGAAEAGADKSRTPGKSEEAEASEEPDESEEPGERAAEDAVEAGTGTGTRAGEEAGQKAEKASEATSVSKSASKSAPKWAVDSGEDAEPVAAEEDAEPKSGKAGLNDKAGLDGKAGLNNKAGQDDDASGAEDDGPEAGEDAEGDASDSPVDQPTAVFKAVRPAKPAVDQPTTMLKLGGAAQAAAPEADKKGETDKKGEKAAGKPEPDAGSAAEAEAERTSKFVALKPLDDPSTRRPKPSGPAKPAGSAKPAAPAKPAEPADATAVVPLIGPERTTQQPLPPKPPLDLLAELTNTPPPPPTPLRTLARRVKIWTPLVILLAVVFAIVQAVRPLPATSLTLTAKDSYTFEGGKLSLPWPGEGQGWMDVSGVGTMGSFGKQTPVAIGSVAKTMTAYVVLKDHPLKTGEDGPSITVDATAEKEGGYNQAGESTLDSVKAGDKLTLKQALSAVMIPSANNIARLLARWDAGTEAAFIEKMNAAAKELGMTNTTYTDPSGLKETTVSTAEDQVKLGNAVVKIPALVAITSAASWTDPSGRYYSNYNELPYVMGAIGIKTGSTTAAGGNLLFASRKEVGGESVTVVGAVLGQHKPSILKTVNTVSRTALEAAEDALTSAKILKKGDVVGYVDDQLGGRTPVVVTKDVTAVGWAGLTVTLEFAADEVPHTAEAGTQVGTLTVGDGSGSAVKVPVALQADLVEPGFSDKLTRIG